MRHRLKAFFQSVQHHVPLTAAIGLNLILILCAFALKADGDMRSSALLSVAGNFHILALHLPAALLLIVPLLEFWEKHEVATVSIRRLSLICAGGTWIAALLGVFHAHFNGYSGDAVQLHLWGGVAASVFASAAWLALDQSRIKRLATQALAVGVMSFAAHIGGELVHEEGFPFRPNKIAANHAGKPGAKATYKNTGNTYADIIAPILEARCVSCHGAKKVKGKLRMDSLEALKKGGGSDDPVYTPGDLKKSGMFTRINLDPKDDDFMPPKDEKPLTKSQVKSIGLWIEGKTIPDDVAKTAFEEAQGGK
jgi:hypothetical protein